MKIKDLPDNTNLQYVPVRLPDDIYFASSLPAYRKKNVPVYLWGWIMGDFFVKLNPKSRKIYPMYWASMPENIKEWEVVC